MSQLVDDDECNICMQYVAFIADSTPWTCEICHLFEDIVKIKNGSSETYNIIWGRYQLPCQHQAHIRCYRKWCKQMNCVSCPTCKYVIEQKPENEYCNICCVYGHPTAVCEQ